jgi:RES domain-containing protein
MRVYRICRSDRVKFDGEGARKAGGRWNRPGLRLVYTAQSESLALLEILVHLIERQMPTSHVCVPAEIPDELVERLPDADLPADWRADPVSTASIGSTWCDSGKLPVLSVPSVVVPRERNYLIKPSHPSFAAIAISEPVSAEFDPRFWKNWKAN